MIRRQPGISNIAYTNTLTIRLLSAVSSWATGRRYLAIWRGVRSRCAAHQPTYRRNLSIRTPPTNAASVNKQYNIHTYCEQCQNQPSIWYEISNNGLSQSILNIYKIQTPDHLSGKFQTTGLLNFWTGQFPGIKLNEQRLQLLKLYLRDKY